MRKCIQSNSVIVDETGSRRSFRHVQTPSEQCSETDASDSLEWSRAASYLYVKTDLQLLFLSQVRDSEPEAKAADMIMPV
jgi:hypothetical protein